MTTNNKKMTKNPLTRTLPDLWYPTTLPKSGIEIQLKPYGMKGNQVLATLLQESEQKKDMKIILTGLVNMMQMCIKPDANGEIIDVNKIHIADFVFISNKIRAITKGTSVKYVVPCDNLEFENKESEKEEDKNVGPCEHKNIVEFDIENYILIGNTDEDDSVVKLVVGIDDIPQATYYMYMREFTAELLFDKPEIISKSKDISSIINLLASFIESVSIDENGVEKKFDELTCEEKTEFLMELTEPQLQPLVDWFHGLARIVLKKEFVCSKCKKKQEIVIDDLVSFLK
jgi:hypothetical protein